MKKINSKTVKKLVTSYSYDELVEYANSQWKGAIEGWFTLFKFRIDNKHEMHQTSLTALRHQLISAGALSGLCESNRSLLVTKNYFEYIYKNKKQPYGLFVKEHSNTRNRILDKLECIYKNYGIQKVKEKFLEVVYKYGYYITMMKFENNDKEEKKNTNSCLSAIMKSNPNMKFFEAYELAKVSTLCYITVEQPTEEIVPNLVPWKDIPKWLQKHGRGIL